MPADPIHLREKGVLYPCIVGEERDVVNLPTTAACQFRFRQRTISLQHAEEGESFDDLLPLRLDVRFCGYDAIFTQGTFKVVVVHPHYVIG